jgi:uncharacterized membrane protein
MDFRFETFTVRRAENMKKLGVFILIVLLVTSLGLSGCGRKQQNVQTTTSTTLGQELVDLQQAYEKGIISEKEYEDLKKKAMKKYK